MKLVQKKIIIFLSTLTTIQLYSSQQKVVTLISPHSQSINAARELVGWEQLVNSFTDDDWYTTCAVTAQIDESFRAERVNQCLFGDCTIDCKTTFTVSGSRTAQRDANDWLADYFGLPTDFISHIRTKPRVSSVVIDCNLYIGLNKLLCGAYVRIHTPLVYTRWDMNLKEKIQQEGTNGYDPGYVNPNGVDRAQLLNSFSEFIFAERSPTADTVLFEKLTAAKIARCSLRATHMAEPEVVLGWNALYAPTYHLGCNLRFGIPTGNTPEGIFLFEPIVGNGHHWQIGFGISVHYTFYECAQTHESWALYADANFSHLFAHTQKRVFDLKNKPLSRYMLAAEITPPVTNMLSGQNNGVLVAAQAQFNNRLTPIANLTHLPVQVSNSLQTDMAIMLSHTKCAITWMIGYGFWSRSCDQLTLCGSKTQVIDPTTSWGIKGDAQLYGFEDGTEQPIALSATTSRATINRGGNFPRRGNPTAAQIAAAKQNPRIDNPLPDFANGNAVRTEPAGADQINTSIQPQFITRDDIDLSSGTTLGRAHKLFCHINYIYNQCDPLPYLGFGAQVEFGQRGAPVPPNKPEACINCLPSVWSVWLKGGVSF